MRNIAAFHTLLLRLVPRALCLLPFAFCLIRCASPGSLSGGPKDETPPKILSCIPGNFSTHFKAQKVEITFDEYFDLKDIAKQLIVSPPMAKKPEFKKNGKKLDIIFKDSLIANRTYAINFGDAIVDLNEGNAIKNFQYVFSTGSSIDSLQIGGQVIQATDGKPAEDILVMLYNGRADSLPLKTIPLYVSRTNKRGKFTVKNLAGGSYKIFALKDGNTNFKYDMPSESIAFMDSLITPTISLNPVDSIKFAASHPQADTTKKIGETKKTEDLKTGKKNGGIKKKIGETKKKIVETRKKNEMAKELKSGKDSTGVKKDSIPVPVVWSKYLYHPDSLDLRLFTEVRRNQYMAGADRPRRDQIRIKFNEGTDSLGLEFLNLPLDSVAVSLEWAGEADTMDFWIMKPSIAALDSLKAIIIFPAFDSIERRITKTDTAKLRYRPAVKPGVAPKKDFIVSSSVESTKTLDFGQSILFTTSLPYIRMDTSLIHLTYGKDSTKRKAPFSMIPDTLKGLVLNGAPVNQVHPRFIRMHAGFIADTTYHLTLLPGAFIGIAGQKSDSIDIKFKMKSKDLYGSLKLSMPSMQGKGILELWDSRNKVVATKLINGPGTTVFDLLAPGKYTARLIFDTNGNGHWDTGRYSNHYQPERVITFTKDLVMKANWEVSETWKW